MTKKKRRHPFVTQALQKNCNVMTVWPSDGEKLEKFQAQLDRLKNDPRVKEVVQDAQEENKFKLILNETDNSRKSTS